MAVERFGERQAFRRKLRIDSHPPEGERHGPRSLRGQDQQRSAVGHQGLVGFARAIPFEHRELRMVQRSALAIAPHARQFEETRLSGRQELLGRKLRRSAQVERLSLAVVPDRLGREGVQVGLVARG